MPDVIAHSDAPNCACTGCSNLNIDVNDRVDAPADASLDPQAGGTFSGKPILSADQVAAWLNRTGAAYTDKPTDARQTDANNSVINFGFFTTQSSMIGNGYTYMLPGNPTLFGYNEIFNFAPFTAAQRDATREAMTAWDDLISISFQETSPTLADINFGNLASAPTTQAYSRLPFDLIFVDPMINAQLNRIAGDVWISASQASNFRLDEGQYGIHTIVHEVGHSLGLSHPGAYNAAPGLSITYGPNAEYAQDTRAYTVMSYMEADSISGTRHFDFHTSGTVYAATPLVHDIAAIQRIYGADMTTRTGDTTYGFNSNAGRDSYDFTKTPAPIMAIWDAGGNDTLDASGYATNQIIDLSPGSLSSIGGVTYETAPSFAQVNANRAANGFAPVSLATYNSNMAALLANPVVGRLTNNVGIAYGAIIENAVGGSGHDSLLGNSVDNVLSGMAGNDIIGAGAGNDTLDGGTGNDTMLGGIGNDTYIVGEAGDVVTELAGEGTDTVRSSIDYTLGANVENLALTGTALNGTGNGLDNVITGNAQNNVLDGAAGADSMAGGLGNDTYIVDQSGDSVTELAGEGRDTVRSAVDYVLGANVEDLVLTGSARDGTGNGLDNVLTGNALANTLNGGAGNDTLFGGDGVDRFIGGTGADIFIADINGTKVASKDGPISLDLILDFEKGVDKIDVSDLGAFTWKGHAANKNAGDLSIKTFGNINAAEKALGIDIDGVDGDSPFGGPVTVVFGNTDGGAADFALVLVGSHDLSNTDFIFV